MKKLLIIPFLFLPFCQTTGLPKGNGTIDPSLFPDKEPVAIYRERTFRPLILSNKAIDLIVEFEGFRDKPYICQAGKKTIGYGFIDSKYTNRKSISKSESLNILNKEILPRYEGAVDKMVKKDLTENQKAALVSFCYNLGEGALEKIANRINSGDLQGASRAMLNYNKVRKNGRYVVLEGLSKRRKKEVEVFNS